MNSQTEAQPLAIKLSKSQRVTKIRRNRDECFLLGHGLVSESKVLELMSFTPERLKNIRRRRPYLSIKVRGQWYYSTNALIEFVEIANILKGAK